MPLREDGKGFLDANIICKCISTAWALSTFIWSLFSKGPHYYCCIIIQILILNVCLTTLTHAHNSTQIAFYLCLHYTLAHTCRMQGTLLTQGWNVLCHFHDIVWKCMELHARAARTSSSQHHTVWLIGIMFMTREMYTLPHHADKLLKIRTHEANSAIKLSDWMRVKGPLQMQTTAYAQSFTVKLFCHLNISTAPPPKLCET